MTSTTFAAAPETEFEPSRVRQAALRAVVYADVFDFPVTAEEVHRYLHGVPAGPRDTRAALEACSGSAGPLSCRGQYFVIRGREHLVEVRRERAGRAAQLWPLALHYGRMLAEIPFVRMVAVTGSLAWDNPRQHADIDYFIICAPGRLWLCRLGTAVVRRMAARRGVRLCVNYIMTEHALELRERNIYAAYELACMRPLAGDAIYRRMRAANAWSAAFLPNAGEHESATGLPVPARGWIARAGERLLGSSLGQGLEWLEMRYRMRKMRRWLATEPDLSEAVFNTDWFKSHTTARAHSTVAAFTERLRQVQAAAS